MGSKKHSLRWGAKGWELLSKWVQTGSPIEGGGGIRMEQKLEMTFPIEMPREDVMAAAYAHYWVVEGWNPARVTQ